MQAELTPKQQFFLRYLKEKIAGTGKSPSLRQAAADIEVSHAAVSRMIRALEEKGFVRREGRYSRTIHLLNDAGEKSGMTRWREIPVVGKIAAGLPLYAQREWAGSVVVDENHFRAPNLFALTVTGDSMRDAAILHNDLVICAPRQYAENNEIVVALIHHEEATVKRFFLHDTCLELRPENPAYPPVKYGFDEVLIQGKVIGVIRNNI